MSGSESGQHVIKDSTMNFTLLKENVRASFKLKLNCIDFATIQWLKKIIKSIKDWMKEINGELQNGKSLILLIEMLAACSIEMLAGSIGTKPLNITHLIAVSKVVLQSNILLALQF